ncbi:MAG: hypothetical protein DMD96_24435 [Candidatus Rokuibacteriota bacterium]|nr:MAG: hypothetical protein DMD96_24435 [Candidatus Rokubacteria bacterium]
MLAAAERDLPAGFFSLTALEVYIRETFAAFGLKNSFAALDRELFIPAIDLDRAQRVVFGRNGLRERLWQQIDLFDAIEFSHFYTPRIDFNRPAVKLAAAVGLPLLGTSDSHLDEQFGTTFSLIEADLSVESVLAAVKHGRLSIVSRPLTLSRCLSIVARQALANARVAVRARLRPTSPAGETILTPR